jgi:hypothetical protein
VRYTHAQGPTAASTVPVGARAHPPACLAARATISHARAVQHTLWATNTRSPPVLACTTGCAHTHALLARAVDAGDVCPPHALRPNGPRCRLLPASMPVSPTTHPSPRTSPLQVVTPASTSATSVAAGPTGAAGPADVAAVGAHGALGGDRRLWSEPAASAPPARHRAGREAGRGRSRRGPVRPPLRPGSHLR